MDYDRPYADLKVLDLSQGVAGPYCGTLLALHGADVIKVEPPAGDWARRLGTRYGDHSVLDISSNRGKRSIALDLKHDAGRDIGSRLAATADVIIEGFRPGVADRLGIGYAEIKRRNPRVLYLSVSGYGQTGPYRDRPGTDTIVQAFSGLMPCNRGNDGVPHRVGFLLVDMVTGLYAFQALAVAIHARERSTEGRRIDVSLIQSAAAIQAAKISEYTLANGTPVAVNAPAGTYRTKDGWVAITLVTEAHWEAICDGLGLPHLKVDPRFSDFEKRGKNVNVLVDIIQEPLLTRTTEDWCARLQKAGGLSNRIYDYGDWLSDPHVQAIGAAPWRDQPDVGPIRTPNIPGIPQLAADDRRNFAPSLGEHGREILRECGYADDAIEELIAAGAVCFGVRGREETPH